MSSRAVRAGLVLVGVAIVAVAIVLYISKYLTSPTPFAAAQTGPTRGQPDPGDHPRGWQARRQPVLGLLSGPRERQVEPHHRLQRPGPFAGPRHPLQLRRRQRSRGIRSCPRSQGTVGGDDASQRQDHRRRSIPMTPRTRSRFRSSGISVPIKGVRRRREEPVRRDAVLAEEGARDDHLHDPHREARAVSAGSASFPARPASSTGSRDRCRRSATWTASST